MRVGLSQIAAWKLHNNAIGNALVRLIQRSVEKSRRTPAANLKQFSLGRILLYQRVSARKKNSRHYEAERAGRFKINDKFEFLRRLNGKVRRSRALEDAIDVIGHPSEQIQDINPVGHQAALIDKITVRIDGGNPQAGGQ